MKRIVARVLAAVTVVALFVGLVYAVLTLARVSEPSAVTVQGLTARRLWATSVAGLGVVGVVTGAVALIRPTIRFGAASGRVAAVVALAAGLIAAINGGLNLAVSEGGPGTGNGVVGGAAAVVLGLIALPLGGLALARFTRAGGPSS